MDNNLSFLDSVKELQLLLSDNSISIVEYNHYLKLLRESIDDVTIEDATSELS